MSPSRTIRADEPTILPPKRRLGVYIVLSRCFGPVGHKPKDGGTMVGDTQANQVKQIPHILCSSLAGHFATVGVLYKRERVGNLSRLT